MLVLYLCKDDVKKVRPFDPFFDKIQTETDVNSLTNLHEYSCEKSTDEEEIKS